MLLIPLLMGLLAVGAHTEVQAADTISDLMFADHDTPSKPLKTEATAEPSAVSRLMRFKETRSSVSIKEAPSVQAPAPQYDPKMVSALVKRAQDQPVQEDAVPKKALPPVDPSVLQKELQSWPPSGKTLARTAAPAAVQPQVQNVQVNPARFAAALQPQGLPSPTRLLPPGTGAKELQQWPPPNVPRRMQAPTARRDPFQQLISKFHFARKGAAAVVQQNPPVPGYPMQQSPVRRQATMPASLQSPIQVQASQYRFQGAQNRGAVMMQAPPAQAFITNPSQPQALNYATPSYSSQLAQANGVGGVAPMYASPAYGHNPATALTGVHPVTPSGVVVPGQAALGGMQAPAYASPGAGLPGMMQGTPFAVAGAQVAPAYGGSMGIAAMHPAVGLMHPAGAMQVAAQSMAVQPAMAGAGGTIPVYQNTGSASGSETPVMLINPYHPLHPLNPLNAASPNLRGFSGVPGSAISGFPYSNQGHLPPMPPGSRSYQESPAPPPPMEIVDTPDILSAPTPPVSPMQLRRFTTQADTGRGMVPSTDSAPVAGGSMSVQMAMPGTAGTMADPSAPLSRSGTLGIM